MPPPILWHFTTEATHIVLGQAGELHPGVHLIPPKDLGRSLHARRQNMAQQLVWLTDLEELDCAALALPLGQVYHRYQVQQIAGGPSIAPWRVTRINWPDSVVKELESEGTQPDHWYVTRGPVPVIYSSYDYC